MKIIKSNLTLSRTLIILINLFFIYYIYSGIKTIFFINNVNRSLWLDEAFLASSFTKRTMLEFLTLGKFENMQSAPLLWLLYEKTLAICFGYTESVLRIGSMTFYILTIFLLILIQKQFFHSKLYLLSATFFATFPFALQYATVFKQYMGDGFVVLLIFTLYILYLNKKFSLNLLRLSYCVLIWASQVSCFFIGGVILTELLFSFSLKDKLDKIKLKETLITGVLICLSFATYYFVFASKMTSVEDMQAFWSTNFFPIFPTSNDDLKKISFLTNLVLSNYSMQVVFLSSFLIGGLYFSTKKEKSIISLYLGIILVLFASSIKMYPIADRTCFFIYPLGFLIFSLLIEEFLFKSTENNNYKVILVSLFFLIIIQNGSGTKKYEQPQHVYWHGEELNKELDFLKKHLKKDEMIYVYKHAVPSFEFKNGYGNNKFKFDKKNVLLGESFISHTENGDNELNKILSYNKVYIVTSHINDLSYRFQRLIDTLHLNGYFELVYDEFGTKLWYFCKKKKNSKFNYELELMNKQTRGNVTFATIRIRNTGKSFINYEHNKSFLLNKKNKNTFFLDAPLAPNKFVDVKVSYKTNSNPKFTLRHQLGKISKRKILEGL